jgi:glutamate-1-semialdehyde 2,1-aminomutase
VHATARPVRDRKDAERRDGALNELLFLDLLEHGYYIAPRGYLALSLAVSESQLSGFKQAVVEFLRDRAVLWARGN